MKIAWLTPFSKKSAAGRYSQAIIQNLSGRCQIDLWVDDDDQDLVDTSWPMIKYGPKDGFLNILKKSYDLVIYHLENYPDYHSNIFEIARRFPGVAILDNVAVNDFLLNALALAYGVITQSQLTAEKVKVYFKGPVAVISQPDHPQAADQFLNFAEKVRSLKPKFQLIDQAREVLADIAVSPDMAIYNGLSAEIDKLINYE